MNERDPDNSNFDELLSAYQDGELSAEERLRLEAELRASPEKRELLRQYSELSGWLKDLPSEESSADLRQEVMDQIESAAVPGTVAPASARQLGRSSSRRIWQWAVSCASVAALVMVLWRVNTPAARQAGEGVAPNAVAMKSNEGTLQGGMKVAASPAPAAGDFSIQNKTATKTPADHRGLVEQEIELGATAAFPAPASASTIARTEGGNKYQYQFSQDISQLQPGQVVRALEHAGEKVSVVTLSVVDRQQALDTLRIVLAKQAVSDEADVKQVPKLSLADSGGLGGGSVPAEKKVAREYSDKDFPLIAVYVEATGGQLEAAIKELKSQERQFLALDVESPLPGTELEELVDAKERPLLAADEPAARMSKDDAPANPLAKPELARSKVKSEAEKSGEKSGEEENRARSFAGSNRDRFPKKEMYTGKVVAGPSQLSRQRAVQLKQLPAQVQSVGAPLQSQMSEEGKVASKSTPPTDSKKIVPAPAQKGMQPDSKANEMSLAKKDATEKPLQVLFVLKQRPEQSAPISTPDGRKKN